MGGECRRGPGLELIDIADHVLIWSRVIVLCLTWDHISECCILKRVRGSCDNV